METRRYVEECGKMKIPKPLIFVIFLTLSTMANAKPYVFSNDMPAINVQNPTTGDPNFHFLTNSTTIGDRFNMTVWVENVTDLFSYQILLNINDTIVNITNAWLPTWEGSWVFHSNTTVNLKPVFYDRNNNNKTESVLVGDSLLGSGYTFNGSGLLAIIELEITLKPPENGRLETTLNIKNTDTILLNNEQNEIPSVKNNGIYMYTWVQLENPRLKVSPTRLEYGPEPPQVIGETFQIKISIENLHVAWNLETVVFSLDYDPNLIIYKKFQATPAWSSYSVTPILGSIIIVVGNPENAPFGEIELIQVEFEIKYQGFHPETNETDLELKNIKLYDTENRQIPTDPPINGKLVIIGAPQPPWPEIQPYRIQINKTYPTAIGYSVEIDLTLTNLNSSWKLREVSVNLTYDTAMLKLKAIEEGDFLTEYGITSFNFQINQERLVIKQRITDLLTQEPQGEGTIAKIRLIIVNQSNAISETLEGRINITEIELKDFNGNTIPINQDQVKNGVIKVKTTMQSQISLTVNPTSTQPGSHVKIEGNIIPEVSNATISIYVREIDGKWKILNQTKTDENGKYSYLWNVNKTGIYEIVAQWQGDQNISGNQSRVLPVIVEELLQTDWLQPLSIGILSGLISGVLITAVTQKKLKKK